MGKITKVDIDAQPSPEETQATREFLENVSAPRDTGHETESSDTGSDANLTPSAQETGVPLVREELPTNKQ
jgi:hypothetical protein